MNDTWDCFKWMSDVFVTWICPSVNMTYVFLDVNIRCICLGIMCYRSLIHLWVKCTRTSYNAWLSCVVYVMTTWFHFLSGWLHKHAWWAALCSLVSYMHSIRHIDIRLFSNMLVLNKSWKMGLLIDARCFEIGNDFTYVMFINALSQLGKSWSKWEWFDIFKRLILKMCLKKKG